MFTQIYALSRQHLVSLIFDHIHFFTKFDFASVQIHQDVNVQGVHDLVLFREELLSY